jgi:hypothetical protein
MTRVNRRKLDKFASVRDVFAEFVASCQKYMTVNEYCTIDEMLEAF